MALHCKEDCCCGKRPRSFPSITPGKLLRECEQGVCGFAMETEDGNAWAYSFEAERISASKRHAKHASTACKGIMSNMVHSLATAPPHVLKEPNNVFMYLEDLADSASSRPIFQRLYDQASDKLTCIKELAPHMYLGTGEGIRSGFCSHQSNVGQCVPCQLLIKHANKIYASRAHTKAEATIEITHAILKKDNVALAKHSLSKAPLQNLTAQELRHRAFIDSTSQRAEKQRATRAKYSMGQLKVQVQVFKDKLAAQTDDAPELVKLFTMVTESGTPHLTCNA